MLCSVAALRNHVNNAIKVLIFAIRYSVSPNRMIRQCAFAYQYLQRWTSIFIINFSSSRITQKWQAGPPLRLPGAPHCSHHDACCVVAWAMNAASVAVVYDQEALCDDRHERSL